MNEKVWNELNVIIEQWLDYDPEAQVYVNLIENEDTRLMAKLNNQLIGEDIKDNVKVLLDYTNLQKFKSMLDTGKLLAYDFNEKTNSALIRIYFNNKCFDSFIEFEIILDK